MRGGGGLRKSRIQPSGRPVVRNWILGNIQSLEDLNQLKIIKIWLQFCKAEQRATVENGACTDKIITRIDKNTTCTDQKRFALIIFAFSTFLKCPIFSASQRGYEFSENNQILYIPHFTAKKDDGIYNCNAAQYSSFETLSVNVTGYGECGKNWNFK